jgi:hypothetical protein
MAMLASVVAPSLNEIMDWAEPVIRLGNTVQPFLSKDHRLHNPELALVEFVN